MSPHLPSVITHCRQVFCDFGENFTVFDMTGEQPISVIISSVTKETKSVVTCSDETRHNFESGDYVTFTEVEVSQSCDLFRETIKDIINGVRVCEASPFLVVNFSIQVWYLLLESWSFTNFYMWIIAHAHNQLAIMTIFDGTRDTETHEVTQARLQQLFVFHQQFIALLVLESSKSSCDNLAPPVHPCSSFGWIFYR